MDSEQQQSLIQTFIDGVQQGIILVLNVTLNNPVPETRAFFWFITIVIIIIGIINLLIARRKKRNRK